MRTIWAGLTCLYIGMGAAALATAAQPAPDYIDSFGPYKLGMTADQAKAAHKNGKPGPCGDIASDRQCVALTAAVFEEPAVIYAVLDAQGAKVERIVAQLDPQLTQRRAYRCVRLAEKVFSLLAVVYGSKFKQNYDQNRKPLPAVAWDGEVAGRLIFETRCRSAEEGKPRISIVEHRPEGVPPPKQAEKAGPKPPVQTTPAPLSVDPPAAGAQPVSGLPPSISLSSTDGAGGGPVAPEAPVPLAAPVGAVEEIGLDTSGATAPDHGLNMLARELAHAKSTVPPALEAATSDPAPAPAAPGQALTVPTPAEAAPPPALVSAPAQAPASGPPVPAAPPAKSQSVAPPAAPRPAQSLDAAVAARLAAPTAAVQPHRTTVPPSIEPSTLLADELPELPDMVAPEPFMVPEEEAYFRQRREAPSAQAALRKEAAAAPFALLSVSPPSEARPEPRAAAESIAAPQPAATAQTQTGTMPAPSPQPQRAVDAGRPAPVPQPVAAGPESAVSPAASRLAVQEAAVRLPKTADPEPLLRLPSLEPVLTGGWRHRAPVPPARPWRDRADAAGGGAS